MSTAKSKKTGLGRGFDALIPDGINATVLFDDQDRVQRIPVDSLGPNPDQPRSSFDQEALSQLSDSIKKYGILQPLVVTPNGPGKYTIVAGERRWRAAKLAGESKVPVIVRTTQELERLEIALIENVQRVDLSLLEQASSIEKLHQQFSLTYESVAKRLGKATSTVHNIVRLLQLPKDAAEALAASEIYEGHARTILSIKDMPDKQAELLSNIKRFGWSVRQAEQFVTSLKEGYKETALARERMRTQTPETIVLSQKLGGNSVHIRRMAKGGKLEISFTNDDDLNRILASIS